MVNRSVILSLRPEIKVGDLVFRSLIFDRPHAGIVLSSRVSKRWRYGTNEKRLEYEVWANDTQRIEWVDELSVGIEWVTVDTLLTFIS